MSISSDRDDEIPPARVPWWRLGGDDHEQQHLCEALGQGEAGDRCQYIGTDYTNWFNKVIDDTEHRNIEKVENQMKDQSVVRLSDGGKRVSSR
jgi:hypothetical protein